MEKLRQVLVRHDERQQPRVCSSRRRGLILYSACLAGALLATSLSCGMEVTQEGASAAVKGWLRVVRFPLSEPLPGFILSVQPVKSAQGEAAYYVVRLRPSGFVILSADDLIEPVVAFSAEGGYELREENPLKGLVETDLAARMAQARAAGLAPAMLDMRAKWQLLHQYATNGPDLQKLALLTVSDLRVAPLVQSRWSQETSANGMACYNYYVPPGPNGNANNYPCGCVATAMAQLMNYWHWPAVGVGTASFNISVNGASQTARLRGGNGSGGPYNWTNMLLDPAAPTVEQCQAIGALTYDAGVAVNMSYASDSSGAGAYSSKAALLNTFKYGNLIIGENSHNNIGSALPPMVNANLDARYPVLLSLTGPSSNHKVVCDGYGYVLLAPYHHLNLGWAGAGTAWYSLPTIDSAGIRFTNVYLCMYNIFPTGTGEIISGRVLCTNGTPLSGAVVRAIRAAGGTYQATTDTNGIYALVKVPSASQYAITASKQGYTAATRTFSTSTSTDHQTYCGNYWGANFNLSPTNAAPLIIVQPVNQSAMPGGRAFFSAAAVGAAPLEMRWLRNGVTLQDDSHIRGAATTSLVLSNLSAGDAGSYQLLVTNRYGYATTAIAELMLYAPGPATVVDFEDLNATTNDLPVPADYKGFRWNNFACFDVVQGAPRPSGYQAGAHSPTHLVFNPYGQPASLSSTGLFNFVSAWVTAAWNSGLRLQVDGYAGGRLVYSTTNILSATSPTLLVFNFMSVEEVDFSPSGGTLQAGYTHSEPAYHFTLDDIVVQTSTGLLRPPVFENCIANGTHLILSWRTIPGQRYQVQSSSGLAMMPWIDFTEPIVATNTTSFGFDTVRTGSYRFYRVVVVP